jgi:CRP-like cAMP-binding protein
VQTFRPSRKPLPCIIPELTDALLGVAVHRSLPPRTQIYARGELAQGIYLLRSGRAVLFAGPRFGSRRQRVEMAEAGAILGLGEVLAEGRYCLTAESAGTVEAGYVSRGRLLALLRTNTAVSGMVRLLLVQQIDAVHHAHRLLGGPGLRSPRREIRTASA